ncbi:MAG: hypothetical protein FJ224_06490 [Lentisphaerae bacterium]|nr:hypothetical protein [Lentisphaerota bacterium]
MRIRKATLVAGAVLVALSAATVLRRAEEQPPRSGDIATDRPDAGAASVALASSVNALSSPPAPSPAELSANVSGQAFGVPVKEEIRQFHGGWERVRLVRGGAGGRLLLRVRDRLEFDKAAAKWRVEASESVSAEQVVAALRRGASVAELEAAAAAIGGRVTREIGLGAYVVSLHEADFDSAPRAAAALARDPAVRYAHTDGLVQVCDRTPNDPSFSQLWGLHNTGQAGGTVDADIDAPAAWAYGVGSTQVVVGVVDTGMDLDHPDLAANLWTNPGELPGNGLDDDGNGYVDDVHGFNAVSNNVPPEDDHYHGTHVSGTIGAVGSNAVGVAGVCWSVKLMQLKVIDSSGSGLDSEVAAGLIYAYRMRTNGVNVRITNNSYGGDSMDQVMADAIAAHGEAGMLFVAAAGNRYRNTDADPYYPAGFDSDNVVAVANTDRNDALTISSNFGQQSVDLGAPGTLIYSTYLGGSYANASGTSMAAPHVAGAAALLFSLAPGLSVAEVKALLMNHGDPIASLAGKTVSGRRLNLAGSVAALPVLISHEPRQNTLEGEGLTIDAGIQPATMINTNATWLLWNTNGSTTVFSSNRFARAGGDLFSAVIPTQVPGAAVHYWFRAKTVTGQEAREPADAPASLHSFEIAAPVWLTVTGTPALVGSVAPPYGVSQVASGAVVKAVAEAYVPIAPGERWACAGWTGFGDTPPSGSTNVVEFRLDIASGLTWQWVEQVALVQTSSVAGLVNAVTWWNKGGTATTVRAPEAAAPNGTEYWFAGWYLEGARQPDATNASPNPLAGIACGTPRSAGAFYMPASADSDSDGLPDAWELRFFGSNIALPYGDPDGDGYVNLVEMRDRSNPRDPASVPLSPVVRMTPPANPMPMPGPYRIGAVVTDSVAVAQVTMNWSRNYGPWSSTAMVAQAGGEYSGTIPAPGTNGDHFSCFVFARDPSGQVSAGDIASFNVAYALPAVDAGGVNGVVLQPGGFAVHTAVFTNFGHGAYEWKEDLSRGFADDVERGPEAWTHGGTQDVWHVESRRHFSPTNSWCFAAQIEGAWRYPNAARASLVTPWISLLRAPRLRFKHWIDSELDPEDPAKAYDGGIVEISTDGATFKQIAPTNGYPYLVHSWYATQFPPGSRLYAGTGGWQQAEFDLSAYADSNVVVRFTFASDNNSRYEGWYIDDVAVTSATNPPYWLAVSPTNGVVPPGGRAEVQFRFCATNMLTGNRGREVRFTGNAPLSPAIAVPASMLVRSPPRVSVVSAAQSSTNGEGLVTATVRVWDFDGDTARLTVEHAGTAGTWTNALLRSVVGSAGAPVVSNAPSWVVAGIATKNAGKPATNLVTMVWESRSEPGAIVLSTAERLRFAARDELFAGAAVTSGVFMVDNEPPSPIGGLTSLQPAAGTWSTQVVVNAAWEAPYDGAGTGVAWYDYVLRTGASAIAAGRVAAASVSTGPLPCGTNGWLALRTADAAGNRSGWFESGPFMTDTLPPDPSGAEIGFNFSRYGAYVVGSATGTWHGFTDTLSGILGYYVADADRGGTTNGAWTTGNSAEVLLAVDSTNTVYVWGQDRAGGIGAAASAQVIVLDSMSDFDGDGLNTAGEEAAGTDAANASSVFELSASRANDAVVLEWNATSNRIYEVEWKPSLTGDWNRLVSITNMPGFTGVIGCTDAVDSAAARYYRVRVRPTEAQ